MKTAIIFCSKHGAVRKIAGIISEKINEQDIEIIDLDKSPDPEITRFDVVVIGGSIYFGQIQKRIKSFCEDNSNLLLNKKTALFISCLTKEKEQEEFELAFPEELRKNNFAHGLLGGELIYSKLNLLEKIAIKFVGKDSVDVHEINYQAINEFAEKIKEQLLMEPGKSCLVG